MADDLITFLHARLAEDVATAARSQALRDKLNDPNRQIDPNVRNGAEYAWCETATDPARLLREVEAKRALITFAFENAAEIDGEWGDGHGTAEIAGGQCEDRGTEAAARILVPLAAIWRDHPDYRPEWALGEPVNAA